jgi:hypothetical protein
MIRYKEYRVHPKIENDPPYGNLGWYTISFLTPEKMEHLRMLRIRGIKVHNGYTTLEAAREDLKRIREKYPDFDVYLAEMGKIYSWDEITYSEMVHYDNEKLNEMEKTRLDNLNQAKLLAEQFQREHPRKFQKDPHILGGQRTREKLRKRLYQKGVITRAEFDVLSKPLTRREQSKLKVLEQEISQLDQDYLIENEPVALKYGCLSIYSPHKIHGLENYCFKVRGLFGTQEELMSRTCHLVESYPDDPVYSFEVGKWCAFTEEPISAEKALQQLNYVMKCYLDHLTQEKVEFEKRRQQTQQASKVEDNEN